jgi:hypothetical protein
MFKNPNAKSKLKVFIDNAAYPKWPKSSLGPRITGNANPAGAHHHKRTDLNRFSVFIQYLVELFDLNLEGGTGKPEEWDACMGEALLKDQFAEIAVYHNRNPLLVPRHGQHILIGKPRGIIARDGSNVISMRALITGSATLSLFDQS